MIISSDCIEGKIPPNIEGTVFGNGVGRQRYGEHVYGHWFEGDGHVTSFCYKEGKVRVRNKFVDQRRYKENAAANKIVSRGPWTNVNGGVFGNAFRLSKTNPSNTSVIHHGGKLFALCEAGAPVEMGDDLSTIGERTFGDLVGSDGKACTFSAHYKIDPATGTVFNHGMVYGKDSSMSLFSWNKNLEMQKITTVPLEPNTIQFVHDSCFSKKYSTFFFDSFKADKKGLLSVLLGYKPLGYAFEEHIGEGTRVVVLNRENGTIVADMKIEDTHTYHFVTGVDRIGDDGEELLDVYFFRYMDRTGLEEFLRSVYTRTLPDAASATLWKYTFDVTHKKLM
uniref:Uncharacterized protein n=1 Tax=Palpitomonas bilix TaxID=652834 RepID=A0A7S3CY99_9EUKA